MQQRGIRIRGRMIPAGTPSLPAPGIGRPASRHAAYPRPGRRAFTWALLAPRGPERGKAQKVYFAAPATGVYGSMNSPSAFTGSHFS